MTDWSKEILSEEPSELQNIGPNLYMQRRNITKIIDEEDSSERWECESREISSTEYNQITIMEQLSRIESILTGGKES